MRTVAALFVRADSIYKSMPGVDCWDADRDARLFPGGMPVVAHPPCRLWGRMACLSSAPASEKELAIRAVELVRTWGGVLEHPAGSRLWLAAGMPTRQEVDAFGGWTLTVDQFSFGHPAQKATYIYIVGCPPARIPTLPIVLGQAQKYITTSRGMIGKRCTQQEREATPPAFAKWLVDLARRCAVEMPMFVERQHEKVTTL